MMLEICHDREKWDDYVLEHGGHPLQLWGWGELKAAHGWEAQRLFLRDTEDKIVGAASVLARPLPWPFKSLAYVPRGPIVGENERGEMLLLLARYVNEAYGSVAVMIEPDSEEFEAPEGWEETPNHILPSNTIILDLKQSEDDLLADMAKKTRQYIRKSSGEQIEIRMVKNKAELRKCMDIYHETAARAGFALHGDEYYYDVFDKLGDHSPVFAAYNGDTPVAFLWLAISADTAYELYGGMNQEGQSLRANYALKWHAIRKCKEWGLSRYDFGGLLDGGVTTFKMGWAEGETRLAGSFVRPLSRVYPVWGKGLPLMKSITRKIKSIIKR